MGLNRHTSSDESGGNLGAELSYHIWSSISSGESINSDFCSENFGFGQNSEIIAPVLRKRAKRSERSARRAGYQENGHAPSVGTISAAKLVALLVPLL